MNDEDMKMAKLLMQLNRSNNAPLGMEMPRGPISIGGGGGVGGGLVDGGITANYAMPIGRGVDLGLSVGGGGASGSVPTPYGRQRVKEFSPYIGVNYMKRF